MTSRRKSCTTRLPVTELMTPPEGTESTGLRGRLLLGGSLWPRVSSRSSTGGGLITELTTQVSAVLATFKVGQVVPARGVLRPPLSPGHLDIYSGSRGVSKALVRRGANWILCFDFLRGPSEDLGNGELCKKLEWLIRLRLLKVRRRSHAPLSTAVTPPVRSMKDGPYGIEFASEAMKKDDGWKRSCSVGSSSAQWLTL